MRFVHANSLTHCCTSRRYISFVFNMGRIEGVWLTYQKSIEQVIAPFQLFPHGNFLASHSRPNNILHGSRTAHSSWHMAYTCSSFKMFKPWELESALLVYFNKTYKTKTAETPNSIWRSYCCVMEIRFDFLRKFCSCTSLSYSMEYYPALINIVCQHLEWSPNELTSMEIRTSRSGEKTKKRN